MADKGLASIYTDKTGIYKHREWRGLKDTAYDYKMWCGLWGTLLKWALGHPVTNVKALFRYRWMYDYLKVPSFYDRIMEGARGAALKASRNNMNALAVSVTQLLDTLFEADLHLHPGDEKAIKAGEKILPVDELIPALIFKGFPDLKPILWQEIPEYLPSLINCHSPEYYIAQTESYGLPADVCPLPVTELGIAIDDDYPVVAAKGFVSCNMPCDGSIMTSALQDRRYQLPTYPLNIPLRWKRDDVQEYAIAELREMIKFVEKQYDTKYDWDALRAAIAIWNEQVELRREKWELNRTDIPPHTGSTMWLYSIFEHQVTGGETPCLENDKKVNAYLREQVSNRECPKVIKHRAVIWNTPANMYANFNAWILNCWGVDVVADMIDFMGFDTIDTTSEDTILAGLAKQIQGATMRVHTKGGIHVMFDDLWAKVAEYNADMVIMFDQISCKGVGAINGLFEEEARKRGINFVWVKQDLFECTSISRRDMREDINDYMSLVMREEPLDPSLVDFDDSECW